jgi:hypothetical protein
MELEIEKNPQFTVYQFTDKLRTRMEKKLGAYFIDQRQPRELIHQLKGPIRPGVVERYDQFSRGNLGLRPSVFKIHRKISPILRDARTLLKNLQPPPAASQPAILESTYNPGR